MIINKTFLAGLVGVSLCMANISGIVTDTGTTPISGAVVRLVNGGQIATTGADGSFTLVTTATLPVNGKLLPKSLSAGVAGNLMTVTIGERSVVEITTFDLTGKALSKVRQAIEPGVHTIALPQRSAGVYLYSVKSGNGELLLKGNSVGGATSGSALATQGFSSSKQAKAAVAINDVIAVTKTGYLNYRCVQYNSDTAGIEIKMIASTGTVTDVDGNVYQTVKIGNQVWITENLRTTKYNDGSAITKVTDSAAWGRIYDSSLATPAYCYYNNTTNADSIKKYGALYNWYVVSPANPKKLAPAGWHVPSDSEWTVLKNYLVLNGYNWDGTRDTSQGNNKIAKSLAAKTDWYTDSITEHIGCDLTKNNCSGFSALPGGFREYFGMFCRQSDGGFWWSTTLAWDFPLGALNCHLYYDYGTLFWSGCSWSRGFSVRLLRD